MRVGGGVNLFDEKFILFKKILQVDEKMSDPIFPNFATTQGLNTILTQILKLHPHYTPTSASVERNDILPLSSRDFDPEAHPELKKPPDPSEISIQMNFRKPRILIRKIILSRNSTKKFRKLIIRSFQLLIRNNISLIRGETSSGSLR